MPLIIAHRGACFFAPENTVPAFRKAVELGVDGIETDVQLAKDGSLVIHHNYSVVGTSGYNGKIADMTLKELKELDFGSYKGTEYSGTQIATLDECLDAAAPLKYINLELKAPIDRSIPFVEKVIDAVKCHHMEEKIVLSAFDHSLLRQSKRICPQIRVAALTLPPFSDDGTLFGIPLHTFPADIPLCSITEESLNFPDDKLPQMGSVDVIARSRQAIVMELVYGIAAMYPGLSMPEAVQRIKEMDDLAGYIKTLDFKLDYLHPGYQWVMKDESLVHKLAEMGIGVSPYTPDKPEELEYLWHKSGCYGIITNRPDILLDMKQRS